MKKDKIDLIKLICEFKSKPALLISKLFFKTQTDKHFHIALCNDIENLLYLLSELDNINGIYFEEKGIYKCNCNGTSFTGDQCEVAIVEEVMNHDNFTIISEIKP